MMGRLAPVLLVLLAVSGCGGHRDSNAGISGPPSEITGRLEGVGGPAPGAPRPWAGTVTLTPVDGDGSQTTTVHTDPDGRFSFPVSVGSYTLTGTSPRHYPGGVCRGAHTVDLREHQTVHANVLCQMR
jgi:hypothetical protein